MKGKVLICALLASLVLLNLASAEANEIPVSTCQVLDMGNAVYVLQKDIVTSETCFIIGADFVTLDLRGYTVTGANTNVGVDNNGYNSMVLKNGRITNFNKGIYIRDGSNNQIINNNFDFSDDGGIFLRNSNNNLMSDNILNSNEFGIFIEGGSNNIIRDSQIFNSGYQGIRFNYGSTNNEITDTIIQNSVRHDFFIATNSVTQCNHQFTNVIGTGNKPILFFKDSVEISDLDVSEMILCNADNSVISGVTLNNENQQNNGLLLLWTDNTILSHMLVNNSREGIYMEDGNYNTIINSELTHNRQGLEIYRGDGNSISDNHISDNSNDGLTLDNAINSIVENNYLENNGRAGVDISGGALNNIIRGNFIKNNEEVGIDVGDSNNLFFNNFISNQLNVEIDVIDDDEEEIINAWNTDLQNGLNIVGGNFLGGNYWANPFGTGFSETCGDSDEDGICDEPYVLEESNIDYLPLTSIAPKEPSLSITKTQELTLTQNGILSIINTGDMLLTNVTLSAIGDFEIDFSHNNFNLPVQPGAIALTQVSLINLDDLEFGQNIVTITAQSDEGAQDITTFTLKETFCKNGEIGALRINDVSIENADGEDDKWILWDYVEIDIEIKNEGDEKIKDVIVELGLFDSSGRNVADDLEFFGGDEEVEIGSLNDGERETASFKFKVPADFEDGDYKLTVKAYSDELGEENECVDSARDLDTDFFQEIEIEREDDESRFIIFDNVVIEPSETSCGDSVTLTADIYNIGEDDQDRVRVNLVNNELGLDEFVEIMGDFDVGDEESVSFDFVIPNVAKNKIYQLRLSTDYDFKRNAYSESSDEELIELSITACGVTPIVAVDDNGQSGDIIYLGGRADEESEKGFFSNLWEEISSWFG
ncbi:MAG: putative S-layer protein [Nanoarchaeota archaeon]|nr:putative S-layer protein [Nanoarchaeota archaeon]MBU1103814.1 putative S-layer protein [Nanoarchaeota archaeon]